MCMRKMAFSGELSISVYLDENTTCVCMCTVQVNELLFVHIMHVSMMCITGI